MFSLKALRHVTINQFRSMLRNRIAFFFNLVMPLIFLLIFGSMYGGDKANSVTIGVVDLDQGTVSQQLQQALDDAGLYKIVKAGEADLRQQLMQGKVQAVVVLPQGLSQQVAAHRAPGAVQIVFDQSGASSGAAMAGLQNLVARQGMLISGAQPGLIAQPEGLASMAKLNVFDYLLPGELTQMLLTGGIVTAAIALASQRASGALRHLFSTPLTMGTYVTARIVSTLLLTVLQTAILFGVAKFALKIQPPSNPGATALVLLMGTLATLGLGMLTGALTKGPEAAMPVAMILYMGMAFLGNAMMPMDGAPGFVQALQRVVPTSYLTHALRLVMMQGKGVGEVWGDLAVLAVVAVVTMSLAGWRMRKQFVAS